MHSFCCCSFTPSAPRTPHSTSWMRTSCCFVFTASASHTHFIFIQEFGEIRASPLVSAQMQSLCTWDPPPQTQSFCTWIPGVLGLLLREGGLGKANFLSPARAVAPQRALTNPVMTHHECFRLVDSSSLTASAPCTLHDISWMRSSCCFTHCKCIPHDTSWMLSSGVSRKTLSQSLSSRALPSSSSIGIIVRSVESIDLSACREPFPSLIWGQYKKTFLAITQLLEEMHWEGQTIYSLSGSDGVSASRSPQWSVPAWGHI